MAVRKKLKKRHILLKVILFTILGLVAAAGIFVAVVISKAPDLSVFDAEPEGYMTTVLDTDGETSLTLVGAEANRVYVTLDKIPADLQHAFVAIEDERFYEHHGVDLKGILRAIWKGITTGNLSQGASTITQQLIKNNVFTDSWMQESGFWDSLTRKIQEQYLALKLETMATKDWILENYLNTINLGGGTYGVERASLYYFNKDVSELTLSESAVLAAVTKSPAYYNPLKNPDNNRTRRELVLKNMLDQGYITEAAYEEAMADDVYTRIAEIESGARETQIMDYFQDTLVYTLISDLETQKNMSEEDAWDYLYRGGLTIYSTEDTTLQTLAEEEVNNAENGGGDAQVSLVAIDNETGQVRALIGGRGEKNASLLYNRAISSVRQPGSAIKVIGEYAAGIEDGNLTLGTTLDDAPYTYSNGTEIRNASGTYNGMTTVRQAIAGSINVIALKCFQTEGADRVLGMLQSFGISTLDSSDQYEALAIGGTTNGVTNLEMTAAYSTIARGGTYIKPVYYTKVLDHNGDVILENKTESRQVITKTSAELLTSAMESAVSEGTARETAVEGMASAGKTGTTTGVRDAWFIGFNSNTTCGIWGGYDDNQEQEDSSYVKVIWQKVMSGLNETEPSGELDDASDLVSVKICTKCGNLAVEDLCDKTEQGDMTRTEYYAEGTQPTRNCTCHQSVTICKSSGMKVGAYCPKSNTETKVYLIRGTEGTADAAYVLPESLTTTTCTVHRHFWNSWGDSWGSGSGNSSSSGSNDEDSSSSSQSIGEESESSSSAPSSIFGGIDWFGGGSTESSSEESEESSTNDWWPFW